MRKIHLLILLLSILYSFSSDNDLFRPGQIWTDNRGIPINAHGGGVLYYNGKYYWFGQFMVGG